MKIALLPSPKRPKSFEILPKLIDCLKKHKEVTLYTEPSFSEEFGLKPYDGKEKLDIMITLGGDGTLLWYIRKYALSSQAVFVGLNVGSLGFMADIKAEEMESYVEDLLSGDYQTEERIMLESVPQNSHKHVAVNDIVLHRGAVKNMVHLKVTIDGLYFNTFTTDGLIIATPTGSSAYSLSAGGPLMMPTLDAIIITPICPHSLTNRPFIVSADSVIEIEYTSTYGPIEYTFDGIETFHLDPHASVTITRCSDKFTVASFARKTNYYNTVRSKLHWTGKSLPGH